MYIEYRNKFKIRKVAKDGFDLPMESPYFAQVSDRLGMYLLYEFNRSTPNIDSSLYSEDALFIRRPTTRQFENYKKQLLNLFNTYDLKIKISRDNNIVNYLDATLNLFSGTIQHYHKDNENINTFRNHPFFTKLL